MTNLHPRQAGRLFVVALVLLFLMTFMSLAGVGVAEAATEHCPEKQWAQVNIGEDGSLNYIIPPAGALVCVKGSTDATGIIVADGTSTLFELLGNDHDVSYYVTYGEQPSASTTPSPSSAPSESPRTSPSLPPQTPEPSDSTPPTPTPSSEPTPSGTPTPSATPSPSPSATPSPTLPPTDTAEDEYPSESEELFLVFMFVGVVFMTSILLGATTGRRR